MDYDVEVLVWRVRMAPLETGADIGTCLVDGLYHGQAFVLFTGWKAAMALLQAIADADGEPVVCTAPAWAVDAGALV